MPTFFQSISTLFTKEDKYTPLSTRVTRKRRSIDVRDAAVWSIPAIAPPRVCTYDLYQGMSAFKLFEEDQPRSSSESKRSFKDSSSSLKRQNISYPLKTKREIVPLAFVFDDYEEDVDSEAESIAPAQDTRENQSYGYAPEGDSSMYSSVPSLIRDDSASIHSVSIYTDSDEVDYYDETPPAGLPQDWEDLEISSVGKINEWPGTMEAVEAMIQICPPLPCINLIPATPLPGAAPQPSIGETPEGALLEDARFTSQFVAKEPVRTAVVQEAPQVFIHKQPPAFTSCRRCLHLAHKRAQAGSGSANRETQCKRCKPSPQPLSRLAYLQSSSSSASASQESLQYFADSEQDTQSSADLIPRSRRQLHQAHIRARQERRAEAIRLARGIAQLTAFVRGPVPTYTRYGEVMTTF